MFGKHLYLYEGPVMEFGLCIANHWKATTYAKTEDKARSNLEYRYKKLHNKLATAKIELPGRMILVQ